jgi:2-amino-4-hydroxy-6-hydroxymethyldihydropteridine diphosphokinase
VTRVWLALGSNIGDREAFLAAARGALPKAGVRIVRESHVVETAPVGITDQPAFLNQVLEVETELEPVPLLETVKGIERELGRLPRQRWGPREIDIDILRYDDLRIDQAGLRIPHPELENRPFLLDLLREITAQ